MSNVTVNFLELFFNELYEDFPENSSRKSYKFNTESFATIPDEFYSDTIAVSKRQLTKPSIIQDNIIIRLTKLSCRSLGLYILSLALSQNKTKKILKLNKEISDVHSILIEKPHFNQSKRLYFNFTEYHYRANNAENFSTRDYWPLVEDSFELNHSISFNLVDSSGDYIDHFSNRNDLMIKGSTAGLILFAEYLFNLSLICSKTNYINLSSETSVGDIHVAEESCSGRIEIINQNK